MSQISPYARSTAERSTHWQATAIFLVVAAVVFFSTLRLFDKQGPPDRQHELEKGPTEFTSVPVIKEGGNDWSSRIAVVKHELSQTGNGELQKVQQCLGTIDGLLEDETLAPNMQSFVEQKLEELRQQTAMLNSQSEQLIVNIDNIPESIADAAQSILLAEQDAIHQARDKAERKFRKTNELGIRDVRNLRLQVSDQQDKATNLRRQIAQIQREQEEFRAKAARAEALQRDMKEVERYLQPFTAPGYLQPKSDSNPWDVERTFEAKSVSLARLKRLGALEETMEGLERLYIFGGGKNPTVNNLRPLGDFPQYAAYYLKKPDIKQAVRRAQQLLRDHGQALVEKQMLSP